MALIELSDEEQKGMAEIIDGTLDSMMQDVAWDDPDVQYWINILEKLGDEGNMYADAWKAARDEELNS